MTEAMLSPTFEEPAIREILQSESDLLHDAYAIRYEDIALIVHSLPYANPHRVAIQLLACTGMRPSELDGISLSSFVNQRLADGSSVPLCEWNVRKVKRSVRREPIGERLRDEIKAYTVLSVLSSNGRLFPFTAESLRRWVQFNVRPQLGGIWLRKRPTGRGLLRHEYISQLKGFRHTFAATVFFHYIDRYESAEVAIGATAKRMRHNTSRMTARHYTADIDYLREELQRYEGLEPFQILDSVLSTV